MQLGIEAMRQNGEMCSITSTSSIDGIVIEPEFFAYCAAKGALVTMTKAAAVYCGDAGLPIRVNAVHPGYIATQMMRDEAAQKNQTYEEYAADLVKKHPIGYLGTPDDVAHAFLYLSSDEAKFVTGISLLVDGGYTAR